MLPIYPYADEQEHVSLVYDAPMAFQIHFCLTITHHLVNLPTLQPLNFSTRQLIISSPRQLVNSLTCQPVNRQTHQLKNLNCYLYFYNTVLILTSF